MASAKQIAWRKKFGRMAKAGKFKKSKKAKSSNPHNTKPKKSKSVKERMAQIEKEMEAMRKSEGVYDED